MRKQVLLILLCAFTVFDAAGQSMHFSQYYNAPMLLNAANTALMPDNDFRVGLNYRNQWAAVPVPYNTFSAFGDFKVGGNSNNERHNNWLGVGLAMFDDKAGDGDLSLFRLQGDLAYHLQLSEFTMISLGLSGATVQRSVNFDNLTFDSQWDGLNFNTNLPNNEKVGTLKTSYYTVGAGFNFAWFPSDAAYIKLGGGVDNINEPSESFYGNTKNVIGYRPTVNLDALLKASSTVIINPSVYYTTQTGASELVFGSLIRTMLSDPKQLNPINTELILGMYARLGDAIIGVAGIDIAGVQFTVSYDFTMSALAPYNASYGALEFSLIYQGKYYKNKGINRTYNCPRFF
jgi:type IX secretion system PorP/SprF family membrane protein